jgi:hypothetical protein
LIDQGALAGGVGGPAVGQHVTSPWFAGSWPITQGWGPSSYSGEPEGHGYAHWHAGVDVGLQCGTEIDFPHGLLGVARWVDNPSGYGTALRIELYTYTPAGRALTRKRTFDVWLGHLRQRYVPDGQQLSGGEKLAASNNTGNSTGCHLHFEVRPSSSNYGTDVDPTSMLMLGQANQPGNGTTSSSDGNPYNSLDPRYAVWELEHSVSAGITSAETMLLGVGQTALGTTLLVGGLVIVAFGLRGKSLGQLRSAAVSVATRPSRAPAQAGRRAPAEPAEPAGSTAATTPSATRREAQISRIRVTHQRDYERGLSPEAAEAVHAARSGRGRRLTPEVSAELRRRRFRLSEPSRAS